MTKSGKKNSFVDGKIRLDLVPPEVLIAVGISTTYGAVKYGDRNWELGMPWSEFLAATERHLLAYKAGQDIDPASGVPHLYAAITCLSFLTAYQARGIGEDDRVPLPVFESDPEVTRAVHAKFADATIRGMKAAGVKLQDYGKDWRFVFGHDEDEVEAVNPSRSVWDCIRDR